MNVINLLISGSSFYYSAPGSPIMSAEFNKPQQIIPSGNFTVTYCNTLNEEKAALWWYSITKTSGVFAWKYDENVCHSTLSTWFFSAPPETIILPFQLLLSTLNLHSLFFRLRLWSWKCHISFQREKWFGGSAAELKQEVMTIIEERFYRGAMSGKEAWRWRCSKCQCPFPTFAEDTILYIKEMRGWLRKCGEEEIEKPPNVSHRLKKTHRRDKI